MNSYADLTTLKSSAYLNLSGTGDDVNLRKLLEDAGRLIDKECHRHFYCWEGAKYLDGAANVLFLPDDLLSVVTFKTDAGGDGTFENTLVENTDYRLQPLNGFPKTWVEKGYLATYDFVPGIPRGIQITGVWGHGDGESATPFSAGGTLGAAIVTTSATSVTMTAGHTVAVGHTIRADSEQMYVTAVATNTLTVVRGVNGTTAATHLINAPVSIYQYPPNITQACLVTAMAAWKAKDSAGVSVSGNRETGEYQVMKGLDPNVKEHIKHFIKFLNKGWA